MYWASVVLRGVGVGRVPFFNIKKNIWFIYFWLCLVFIAAWIFLVMASGSATLAAELGFSLRSLLGCRAGL